MEFMNNIEHHYMSMAGIFVCLYALYIEVTKSKNPEYVAFCDFGEHMSCSKVLMSPYSKGFGIVRYLLGEESILNMPNVVLGIMFYTLQLVLGSIHQYWSLSVLYYTSLVSALSSIYLSIILIFKLKDICIVCMITYVLNFGLFYLNYVNMNSHT